MMHEILTLQFGQQANFLGTHYWNTQESYFTYTDQEESPINHDVSFRAGIGADGQDTFTPRTLIYDLKGAFGTLRRENALYQLQHQEQATQPGGWSGGTVSLQLPPIAPSPYQQALDCGTEPPRLTTETVRFWSDYNHLFYHPRSIVQLNEYELNSTLMPFERWKTGEELFGILDREHDLLDRDLRPFLEECDQLQGVQIFAGTDDAWGGFTARYLERMADDLGKGSRWVFELQDGRQGPRERRFLQFGNVAQSLYQINGSASSQVLMTSLPATMPAYVNIDASSRWHTAALQASAIESLTLPTRLRNTEVARATFDQLETTLSSEGNRGVSAASLSVEDLTTLENRIQVDSHGDSRMKNGLANGDHHDANEKFDIDLFPVFYTGLDAGTGTLGKKPHIFSRFEMIRGPWTLIDEMTESNRDGLDVSLRTSIHHSQLLFPLLSSYPDIFRFGGGLDKLVIKAALTTSAEVADRIRSLQGIARRIVSIEEREVLCDGLMTMAEEYEEGWSDDEEYDDD